MQKEVDIDLQRAKAGSVQEVAVLVGRQMRRLLMQRMQYADLDRSALRQLLRSACSVGANVREAQYAESRRDFIHKLKIAEKELSETFYWMGLLCTDPTPFSEDDVQPVLKSMHACKALLQTILNSLRSK